MTLEWSADGLDEMDAAGSEIASRLPSTGWVGLVGDLGAGKTTLVRSIVAALGGDPADVGSPTFAIVHEYPAAARTIWHVDAYRLTDDPHEWEQIGLPDILAGDDPVFVEWPRKEFSRWKQPAATIEIEVDDDDRRFIVMTAEKPG